MRLCSVCQKQDAPWFEGADCTCHLKGIGCNHAYWDDPSPLKHADECRSLAHEVVEYPIRVSVSDLTPNKELSPYWVKRGWAYKQNGMRHYRTKVLCRGCIESEKDTQARRREYEKACKAAHGADDMTYSQMLAQQ